MVRWQSRSYVAESVLTLVRVAVALAALTTVARAAEAPIVVLNEAEFRDRILACWQGKCIGGTLGMPVEGQHGPHKLTWYSQFKPGQKVANPEPNDDLDLQILWLKALEEHQGRVDARILGEYWLKYVPVDWNEYGVGKRNMQAGLLPPVSGEFDNAQWKHSNGAFCRAEIWGCLAPGCPLLAAKMAREDGCVDHGAAEGTWAEMFISSLESAAFVEHDRDKLIQVGLSMIPPDSTLARAIRTVIDAHKAGKSWVEAREAVIQASDDPKKYVSAWFQSPRNIAFIVLGWLYGEDDFGKSLCTAVNCGDDTDTTGAAMGSIFGILHGSKGIPSSWLEPIGRSIKPIAVAGFPMPKDLDEFTDHTVAMTKRVLAQNHVPIAILPDRPTDLSRVKELKLSDPAGAKTLWDLSPWQVVWNEPGFRATLDYLQSPLLTKPGQRKLELTVENLSTSALAIELSLASLPEGWQLAGLPSKVMLDGKGQQRIQFSLQADTLDPQAYDMKLQVTSGERTISIPLVLVGEGGQPWIKLARVGRDDLALASKGAVATSDSELARESGCTRKAIDGLFVTGPFEALRWHSSIETPHPHWIQVKLAKPAKIGRVVLHWADPKGYGVSFEGLILPAGQKDLKRVFVETNSRESQTSNFDIAPVETDTFRLVIRSSANAEYPNAAQLSEIELLPAK